MFQRGVSHIKVNSLNQQVLCNQQVIIAGIYHGSIIANTLNHSRTFDFYISCKMVNQAEFTQFRELCSASRFAHFQLLIIITNVMYLSKTMQRY